LIEHAFAARFNGSMEWAAELNRLLDVELAVPLMVSSASQAAVLVAAKQPAVPG
jgi:hypothetical protein